MHAANRILKTSLLALVAVLAAGGCGSSTPPAAVGSTATPGSGAASATAAPSTASGGAPATVPDPCAVLPKAAIDSILGATAGAGTPSKLGNGAGSVCSFAAGNGASLEVTIENDYASVSEFNDALHFGTTAVPGLGEAARFIYSTVGTPPQATLWIYAKGLSIGTTLHKPGLTEAQALEILKALQAQIPPSS
jgi:hypothetical protein